ncbi:MAG TPA: hypothetical protein DHW02_09730, partial [Ktedonobacter sp.]|nr:hypothetical protein [Ktedonobacter sp.]
MHNPVSRPPTTEYTTFLLLYVVRILGMLLALSGVCMTLYGLYQLIHLHHNSMFLLISAIVTLLTIRIAWLACQDVVLFSHPVDSISSIETMQLKALNHNTMSSLPSSVLAPAQAFSQETVEAPLSFHMQQTSVLPAAHATSTPKPFQLPEYNWSHALLEPVYPDLTSRPDRDSVIGQLDIPYEPIEQDAIFQLDTSVGVRCLMLPKEGEPLVECQDRYALDDSQRCYALADGVSNSFVPGPWARIVTKRFVECGGQLDNDAFFR